ncbi:MAG: hypothetical protein L0I24_00825 [Pseudonocardia sp.]|nr:hypothetical protein [Pseudonocardia sp.]
MSLIPLADLAHLAALLGLRTWHPAPVARRRGDAPVNATQAAAALRGVLVEITNPGSDLTASAATRHRIEGAVIALDVLAAGRLPDEMLGTLDP